VFVGCGGRFMMKGSTSEYSDAEFSMDCVSEDSDSDDSDAKDDESSRDVGVIVSALEREAKRPWTLG
jgi:hypothetical protein